VEHATNFLGTDLIPSFSIYGMDGYVGIIFPPTVPDSLRAHLVGLLRKAYIRMIYNKDMIEVMKHRLVDEMMKLAECEYLYRDPFSREWVFTHIG